MLFFFVGACFFFLFFFRADVSPCGHGVGWPATLPPPNRVYAGASNKARVPGCLAQVVRVAYPFFFGVLFGRVVDDARRYLAMGPPVNGKHSKHVMAGIDSLQRR